MSHDSIPGGSSIEGRLPPPAAASRPTPPSPRLENRLLWIAGSTLAALAIGAGAGFLQSRGIAPVGLAPLAVGVGLGAAMETLGRALGLPIRRPWLVAAVAWALLVVATEDYIGFYGYVRSREAFEQSHPQAALFSGGAASLGVGEFWRFFGRRLADSPVLWSVDLALTTGAAAAWTELRRRRQVALNRSSA